jgi:hypothetical protein
MGVTTVVEYARVFRQMIVNMGKQDLKLLSPKHFLSPLGNYARWGFV